MAGEFKIKTGLLLGSGPSQPVVSIQDSSTAITSDASTILVTGKAIYDYVSAGGGGGGDSYWTLDGSTIKPINSTVTDLSLGVLNISQIPSTMFVGEHITSFNQADGSIFLSADGPMIRLSAKTAQVILWGGLLGMYGEKISAGNILGENTFFSIGNDSGIEEDFILKVFPYTYTDSSDNYFSIEKTGKIYCPSIGSSLQSKALYYNVITGEVTYADPCTGGGVSSVSWGDIAGSLSDQTDVSTAIDSKVNITLFDSSILSLSNNNLSQDASIGLRPLTTYVDGSLNLKVNRTLFDSSIAELTNNKLKNTTDTFIGLLTLDGSLIVSGNLRIDGSTTIVNTTNLDVSDNIVYINSGLTGTPTTNMVSGIKVNRGSSDPYFFIFSEASDTFRIGMNATEGGLPTGTQAVATREDSPIANGIAYWNGTSFRFDTSAGLKYTNNNLTLNGDASITGNIYFSGLSEASTNKILFYNTSTKRITYGDASVSGSGGDSYWVLDGSILKPADDTVNVELSAIQVNTDAGATTLVDMDVSSATTGTEESYAFNIDGSIVAKVYGKAVTGGTLSETGWVVQTAQYMGDPNTDGSWRFYPDSNGDLVFEKRIAGAWTEKGKFTS